VPEEFFDGLELGFGHVQIFFGVFGVLFLHGELRFGDVRFHALLGGASKVGATLHLVAKGFDTGDLLTQVEVPVTAADSVYSLNRRTSMSGGKLLASFLENYDPQSTRPVPQPAGDWKEYTYPTPADVRAFRGKGLQFYKPDYE